MMVRKRCVVVGLFAAVVATLATLLAETHVVATGSNLVFDAKSGQKSLRLPDVRIPVPGNITMRVKTFHSITNGWRRFFASEYRQTGYFGFQEMPGSQEMAAPDAALFFAHDFAGAAVNKFLTRAPVGKDASLSFNIEPRKFTYFLDGEKRGEVDLPIELNPEKLGCLVLGGGQDGFEISNWTLYRRTLTEAEVKALAQGESRLAGSLAWYPSLNALVADFTYDPQRLAGKSLAWRVTPRGGGDVSPAAQGEVRLDGFPIEGGGRKLKLVRTTLPFGVSLADGEYVATLFPSGEPSNVLLEKGFTVKKYDWLGNDLGKEDRLLPGFTAVEVHGPVLTCVGRSYEIGANGLPARIHADGEQILAAPVALYAERDGRAWALSGGTGGVTSRIRSDTTAEYAVSADGYSVSGRLEQDGLLRFTLRFSRLPSADRIWLDIPVKKEFATLFHACGEGVRSNPAGFVPERTGVVFRSRSIPQTHVSNFIPYCWVGTDTRGIAYAADTDLGWIHSEKRDAVEIVRHADGAVSIRLNLLNDMRGSGLAAAAGTGCPPCQFELALMASPVKPMPKGWRGWSDVVSPPYWGNFCAWAGRYPAWGEFEYVRKLREALDTGRTDETYVKQWIERVCEGASPETGWTNRKDPASRRTYVTNHAWAGQYIARSLHGLPDPILYFYTCDAESAEPLAEYAVFRDEWASCKVALPSFADYAIWYFDRQDARLRDAGRVRRQHLHLLQFQLGDGRGEGGRERNGPSLVRDLECARTPAAAGERAGRPRTLPVDHGAPHERQHPARAGIRGEFDGDGMAVRRSRFPDAVLARLHPRRLPRAPGRILPDRAGRHRGPGEEPAGARARDADHARRAAGARGASDLRARMRRGDGRGDAEPADGVRDCGGRLRLHGILGCGESGHVFGKGRARQRVPSRRQAAGRVRKLV